MKHEKKRRRVSADEYFRIRAELDVDAFLSFRGRTRLENSDLPDLIQQVPLALSSPRVRGLLGRLRAPDFMSTTTASRASGGQSERKGLLRKIGNAIATPDARKRKKLAACKRLVELSHELKKKRSPETACLELEKQAREFVAAARKAPADLFSNLRAREALDRMKTIRRALAERPKAAVSRFDQWLDLLARLEGFSSGRAVEAAYRRSRKEKP